MQIFISGQCISSRNTSTPPKSLDVCLQCFASSFSALRQLSLGVEERSSLQAEVRSLRERLCCSDSLDAATTAITGKKLLLLQSQMEQLQEENYRLANAEKITVIPSSFYTHM